MGKDDKHGPHEVDLETLEIRLLIEAIYLRHGYDFRNYSMASLRRRVRRRMVLDKCKSVLELIRRVIHEPEFMAQLLLDFSINVTEMFRDPAFFQVLRKEVVPILRTYPYLRIWHAGCSTGEEVYSMAILLKEEGLYEKTRIYATDFNDLVLDKAREGVFPLESLREYTSNYQRAGGIESFGDYYTARYGLARMSPDLKENIVFANHNLATDGVFGEMHMVICRNVLIYFDKILQDRVVGLFREALVHRGFLCLGSKESVRSGGNGAAFLPFAAGEKIFRKEFS